MVQILIYVGISIAVGVLTFMLLMYYSPDDAEPDIDPLWFLKGRR